MPYSMIDAPSPAELIDALNRTGFSKTIRRYKNQNNDWVYAGLGGTTLIFSSPAATLTFSGAAGSEILCTTFLSELEAFPDVNLTLEQYQVDKGHRVRIQLDAGWTLDKDGTANPLLGFDTVADTVQPAIVVSSKIFSVGTSPVSTHYWALIAP